MTDLTPLEAAVLKATSASHPALGVMLATARVTSRENTGHGFYTQIEANRTEPPPCPGTAQMNGPDADMIDMGEGMFMGFILWFEDGYPDCLEGFQFCDNAGNTVDLHTYDLASLRFTKLVPSAQTAR